MAESSSDHLSKIGTPNLDVRVRQVIDLMGENLDRRLSLREMAQAVHLSAFHLSHLFKTATGYSLIHFHKLLRIERAHE